MVNRELRLALGMRGGVSLAVWIGGACAEIDEVRNAPGAESGFWSELLEVAGYDSVTVDVMAGASAGGLNGVLFAAAQAYGFPMREMREVWIKVADTHKLVRSKGDRPWLSLFKGDDYFFEELRDALNRLVPKRADESEARKPRPRLDLRLAATLVEPVVRAVQSPTDERLAERRYSTGLRFRLPEYDWLTTDFPPQDAERTGNLSRLALAGRCTSSYPGAFEAALVQSRRAESFATPGPTLTAGVDVDLCGILLDRRRADELNDGFVIADGGILDNIPLGLALDAIGEAPADGPTDRYLVYLHPGAPSRATAVEARGADARRSSLAVIKATVNSRVNGEDIRGDIAAIEEHNAAIGRAATIRRTTFEPLGTTEKLLAEATRWRASYRIARANEDARQIRDLLTDPIGQLHEDPFPTHVGRHDKVSVPDARWMSPLHEPPLTGLDQLTNELTTLFTDRLERWAADADPAESVFAAGARPLLRVTQTLLEWCLALEGAGAPVRDEKALLYRVSTFIRVGIDRPRQLGWVAIAAAINDEDGMPANVKNVVQRAMSALGVLALRPAAQVQAVCTALQADDPEPLRAAITASLARIDDAVDLAREAESASSSTLVETQVDLRLAIAREVLAPVLVRLRTRAASHVVPERPAPAAYLDRLLRTPPQNASDVDVLVALEVLCFPEYAAGLPGRRETKFVRLSAANPTPLAPRFTALLDAAHETNQWWDPDARDRAEQQGIHIALKLAGNEVANFSAFLRSEWRENDWMWGTLDTVPTLVEILTPPHVLQALAKDRQRLERLVTGGASEPWQAFLRNEVWNRYEELIADEVAAADRAGLAIDGASAPSIRKALIARRQFERLGHLLPGAHGGPPDLSSIAAYRVGAETIATASVAGDLSVRFNEINQAAARAVVDNAQIAGYRVFGTGPQHWKARIARLALRRIGKAVAKRLVKAAAQPPTTP